MKRLSKSQIDAYDKCPRGSDGRQLHGLGKTPEYKAWCHIKDRCFKPSNPQWKDYGGRGITMCKEWQDNFLAFYAHVGPRPSSKHSIDRKNNDGNYEPGNMRWATKSEQQRNQRLQPLCMYGHDLAVWRSPDNHCIACHRRRAAEQREVARAKAVKI